MKSLGKAVLTIAFGGLFAVAAQMGLAQTAQTWMSSEVAGAWAKGYQGQGVSVTMVDQFNSGSAFSGRIAGTRDSMRHGDWTALQAGLVSPRATVYEDDFNTQQAVTLRSGLNVVNLSYAMPARKGYGAIAWGAQERSILTYAGNGAALVVKSAGNDRVAVGASTSSGLLDYLNRDLIGRPSAIFVGALTRNGTTSSKASLASYSNFAGSTAAVQRQFLVVGVDSGKLGVSGTSFAAPIVSGYAAVLGSKFTSATPTQIANQLLNTARRDTISGYKASLHGRGEASLARALAPSAIH